jgi:hypothetical protein
MMGPFAHALPHAAYLSRDAHCPIAYRNLAALMGPCRRVPNSIQYKPVEASSPRGVFWAWAMQAMQVWRGVTVVAGHPRPTCSLARGCSRRRTGRNPRVLKQGASGRLQIRVHSTVICPVPSSCGNAWATLFPSMGFRG